MSEPRSALVAPPIVELRQYTLHPKRRDDLIAMFDAYFVEPQQQARIDVLGQFRNLDDPNKFVWLRGFPSMEERRQSLADFYGGPVWKAHRTAANETIIDNDNVLLLRPVHPSADFGVRSGGEGTGLVIATIYHIDPTDVKEQEFIDFFDRSVSPLLTAAGAPAITTFIPERSSNTFPGLPVREGEHVFVWISHFPSAAAYDHFKASLDAMPRWRDSVAVDLSSKIREPQTLRLSPTTRSRLHG